MANAAVSTEKDNSANHAESPVWRGISPMIKTLVVAAALTSGLAGYVVAQEASPAAPAQNLPPHHPLRHTPAHHPLRNLPPHHPLRHHSAPTAQTP